MAAGPGCGCPAGPQETADKSAGRTDDLWPYPASFPSRVPSRERSRMTPMTSSSQPQALARLRRVASILLAAALPLSSAGLDLGHGAAPAAAAPPVGVSGQAGDVAIPGGRFYPQAGGFAITDQRGMPFYTAFLRLGGVAVLGYPVSRRFYLDNFTCQAMQGGLLQYL